MAKKTSPASLRRRAEKIVAGKEPITSRLRRDDVANLVHEFEVHQIELEIQNKDLQYIQDQLKLSRDRYADLYHNAPVGYITIDLSNDHVIEANLTAAEILKTSRAKISRSRFNRFIEPEFADAYNVCLREALQEPYEKACELRMRRADGQSFWGLLEIRGVPESVQARLALTDISERKQMENELRIKDHAIASSVSGIVFADLEGKPTYINEAMGRMVGFLPSEVPGNPAHFFCADKEKGEAAMRAVREKGSWQGELAIMRKDGSVFVAQVVANIVRDAEGKPVCAMASLIDITERKRAEQVKDEFIKLVSHELRTPLTIFMGAVRVAMSEGISAEQLNDLLLEAARSADSLAHILDNLIELSRYQSNRLELNMMPTDIERTIGEILRTEAGYANCHRLVLLSEGNLPEVAVDRLRLRQILRNLIDNAAKYSPADTEIRVYLKQDGAFILVGVTDLGKGIAPADQVRLFQPYQRLGDTGEEGLGLGLLVCRRLVEAHGGSIWVESQPGQGATFWFTLPLPGERAAAPTTGGP